MALNSINEINTLKENLKKILNFYFSKKIFRNPYYVKNGYLLVNYLISPKCFYYFSKGIAQLI